MAKIDFGWECPACAAKNLTKGSHKPSVVGHAIIKAKCEACESIFTMKYMLDRKMPGHVLYTALDGKVTEKGHYEFLKRQQPKQGPPLEAGQ
jgi:hypothetical protein